MFPSDQAIPRSLPMMDALVDQHKGSRAPFEDTTLVLIQHQLGSMVPMTEAFIRLGADPRRLHWIDIPYTANTAVQAALVDLGVPRENFAPTHYHLEMPYARYQRTRVQQMVIKLRDTLANPGDRVLVIDDGSYFLEALSCFANPTTGISIVEQTTRGIIKINADQALRHYCEQVTIKNVAESAPKKGIEGPLIGQAVCFSLSVSLAGRFVGARRPRCLVLGFGQIGRSVAESLATEHGFPPESVHVADPSAEAQAAAVARGYKVWDRGARERQRFGLVIGCSGSTSFGIGDRVFLEDGAILASASSGSAELSREAFIELADTHAADDIYVYDRDTLPTRPIHSDIRLRLVDRDAVFLNGGFPVNFDGAINCVPPRFIQATHALQVGAAIEAVSIEEKGLVALTPGLCDWVAARYRELVIGTA
jgi:S-adenosylhomocysteine hydrolase